MRKVNSILHDWNCLIEEYYRYDDIKNYKEAFTFANKLYELSLNNIFTNSPHKAISLMLLGEQAYNCNNTTLAQEYLNQSKTIIKTNILAAPRFYGYLLVDIGDIEFFGTNAYRANKTYLEALKNYEEFGLENALEYYTVIARLVESNSRLGWYSKVDYYMNKMLNVAVSEFEEKKNEENLGEINGFNILAYVQYAETLLERRNFQAAIAIYKQADYYISSQEGFDELKYYLKIGLGKLRSLDQIEKEQVSEANWDFIKENNNVSSDLRFRAMTFKAIMFFEQKNYPAAISTIQQVIDDWRDVSSEYVPFKNRCYIILATIYLKVNEKQKAKDIFLQVLLDRVSSIKCLYEKEILDNKFYFITNSFAIIDEVNEFLISEDNSFPEFRLAYFEYIVQVKNFLYNDTVLFTKMYTTFSDFLNNLNSDEAYIEIVRTTISEKTKTVYLFFIITKETTNYPELIVLENGDELEKKYYRNYINQISNHSLDLISYKIFWEKIDIKIKSKKTIYIAHDGIYRAINLETLRNNSNECLIHTNSFVNIASLNQILNKKSIHHFQINSALLIGYPHLNKVEEDSDLHNIYSQLPHSRLEIELISEILKSKSIDCKILISQKATKANIMKSMVYDIVHIATHGYIDNIEMDEDLDITFEKSVLVLSNPELEGSKTELTGGNTLSANEIRALNLQDVQLVVLSSCVSGIGHISSSGESIGFQLAFFAAGCKNLIISLWKVEDEITKELMVHFYEYLLINNHPSEALMKAKFEIAKKHRHPYFWGGFIIIHR